MSQYTAFKIDRAALDSHIETMMAETGRSAEDCAKVAVDSVAENLRSRPIRYRRFGPYWYAVKAALAAGGHDFGEETNAAMVKAYGHFDGESIAVLPTIVAGDDFYQLSRETYFDGNNEFTLTNDTEEPPFVLVDLDMEPPGRG